MNRYKHYQSSIRWGILGLVLIALSVGVLWWVSNERSNTLLDGYRMSDRLASLNLREVNGKVMVVQHRGTQSALVSADQFLRDVQRFQHRDAGRDWFYSLLDITNWTGMLWVGLGLAGQIVFTGRMLVQWLVSEKHKQSVVPVAFWWMSLIGASMLVVYFTWRVDIVGVLGQSTGWFIYVRNLWLIYMYPKDTTEASTLTQEPNSEAELSS